MKEKQMALESNWNNHKKILLERTWNIYSKFLWRLLILSKFNLGLVYGRTKMWQSLISHEGFGDRSSITKILGSFLYIPFSSQSMCHFETAVWLCVSICSNSLKSQKTQQMFDCSKARDTFLQGKLFFKLKPCTLHIVLYHKKTPQYIWIPKDSQHKV